MHKPHLVSDRDLVRLYQQGQQAAITEIIHRYKQKIYSSIFFLVRDKELSDVVLHHGQIDVPKRRAAELAGLALGQPPAAAEQGADLG